MGRSKKNIAPETFTSAEYRPYVVAIGQLALAWNDLHEVLGGLFCIVAGDPFEDRLYAVWHSATSDRAKRAMLEACYKDLTNAEKKNNPLADRDLRWLLAELNKLEDLRNDAIHAPLASFDHPMWRLVGRAEGIAPDDIHGNRRAAKLRNRDLLNEYRYCRDAAIVLRDFAEAIRDAWGYTEPDARWPSRPKLPNRGQTKSTQKPGRGVSSEQKSLPLGK